MATTPGKAAEDSWLTPEQQKKATVIFLVSVGATLLVTGRSGGSLLKKAKASEGSAAAAGEPLQAATRALQPSRPVPPPPTRSSPRPPLPTISPPPKVVQPPISTALPRAPSLAFLHPNSLTPPKPRRLLPSFVSPSSAVSVLPSRPAPSAFFLPNPTLLSHSTAYAGELDTADKLHEEGTLEAPPGIEDGFNPAVFAAKALGIATLLSFGTFGVGIFGLMKYFGVDDLESLALALQHSVSPVLDANRPTLPSWAQPTSNSSSDTPSALSAANDAKVESQEELSYWASLKEELDKEAAERKIERQSAWERMKKKAEDATASRVV